MQKFKHLLPMMIMIIAMPLAAQQKSSPDKINSFGLIPIQKPVLLDSVNLKDAKFSDETMLSSSISFPEHNRFATELRPDTAGFFHIATPANGHAFELMSFFVSSDRYAKGKLKVTSPNMLELYVDGERKASKTAKNDSLKKAGSAETTLNGHINNVRVVVKMLLSDADKAGAAVKVEIETDKADSLAQFYFGEADVRRIAINDILDGRRVSSASMSPSGRYVLLRFSETLPGGVSKQYVEVYDTKQKRTLPSDATGGMQLSWMPKSDLLSYVVDDQNGRTMYSFDPLTMTRVKLAENLPKESFFMAPDEKSLFYSSKETITINNPAGMKRLLGPDDRQGHYRDRYFIYRYFLDSGLSQRLTFGRQTASINDVSSDASKMVFSVTEEDLLERPFRKSSLYLLDLNTMQVDTLWRDERYAGGARFSPDATKLLVTGGAESFGSIGQNIGTQKIANSYDTQAFIFDLKTKKVDPITKNFDPSIDQSTWNKHDGRIYFRVQDKDRANVYRYDVKSRKFELLPLKEDVVRSLSLAQSSEWAAYTGVSVSNSARSYLLNLKNLQSTLIADPYAERLAKLNLGDVKDWTFKSSFGDVIDGRYYLPPNFDATKKYPLVVYYYAGTTPTQRIFETTYPWHVYAARDYVVYIVQPSGTIGYGQEFAARHVNAWGQQTAEEIIEGVEKFVAAHPFVDGSKIGCIGASYGGFMTQYLQTRTDLFAAAISHAGISNIASYWGEGFWGYSYSAGASAGSFPWNNAKMYVEQSPLFHADKIKTPLLLLHGTADTNVPIGESIQMYTALKLLGKEVEFIQVDGENHAIYDYKKRIAWNNAIYAWFDKWLKGDSRWWDSMYPAAPTK